MSNNSREVSRLTHWYSIWVLQWLTQKLNILANVLVLLFWGYGSGPNTTVCTFSQQYRRCSASCFSLKNDWKSFFSSRFCSWGFAYMMLVCSIRKNWVNCSQLAAYSSSVFVWDQRKIKQEHNHKVWQQPVITLKSWKQCSGGKKWTVLLH